MSFIPIIVARHLNQQRIEKENRTDEELLLMGGSDVMDCNSMIGSEIKMKTTEVSTYKLSSLYIDDYIPQDKEIISIQILANEVSYGKVREWIVVVLYKDNERIC